MLNYCRIFFVIILAWTALFFSACENSEYSPDLRPALQPIYLSATPTSFTVSSDAKESVKTQVRAAGIGWTIHDHASWIKISPTSGNTDTEVELSVSSYESGDSARVSIFELISTDSNWNFKIPMTLSQSAATPYIEPSVSNLEIKADGGKETIRVKSNVKWSAECTASWVTCSYTKDEISLIMEANPDNLSRSASVIVNGGSLSKVIMINQKPDAGPVQEKMVELDALKETKTENITLNDTWEASTSASWIEVSPTAGEEGTYQLSITGLLNSSMTERIDWVIVNENNKVKYKFKVVQKGLSLSVSQASLFFYKEGASKSIDVFSNGPWKIENKPSWIQVKDSSAEGNATCTISADTNNGEERTGKIVFVSTYNETLKATIEITQSKYSEKTPVVQTDITMPHQGGATPITVTTHSAWTASVEKGTQWLSVSPQSGTTTGTLTITAIENNDTIAREGIIVVNAGSYSSEVKVIQQSKIVRVDVSVLTDTPSKGDNVNVLLNTNDTWTAKSDASWITISPTNGEGQSTMKVQIADNATTNSRNGSIRISFTKTGIQYVIPVSQLGRYLRVNKNSIAFASQGGTDNFSVETDGKLSIEKQPDWVSITQSGNVYTVNCQKNESKYDRSGNIVIEMTDLVSGSLSRTIYVSQEPTGYSLKLSPETISAPSTPTEEELTITTNDDWTVTTTYSSSPSNWLTPGTVDGSQNAKLKVSISDNNTTDSRQGQIVVTGKHSELVRNTTILQEGKHLRFEGYTTMPILSVSNSGGTRSIKVDTDGTISVSENENWLSVNTQADNTLVITIDENKTTTNREGIITVALTGLATGYSLQKEIKVKQSGKNDYYLRLTNYEDLDYKLELTSLSSNNTVNVSSNDEWTVTKTGSWISVSSTSGNKDGSFKIVVEENKTVSQRSGSVTVTGVNSGIVRTIDVVQNGKYLEVDPSFLNFDKDGSTKTVSVSTDGTYTYSVAYNDASNKDWLTIGKNGNTLSVKASGNTSKSPRSCIVTVSLTGLTTGSLSKDIPVTQAGTDYHLSVSPNPISVNTSLATTTTIDIETNDSWSLSEVPSWLTPSVSSGTGNKTVTLSLAANNTTSKRHATFKVNGVNSGISVPVEISQIDKDITVSQTSWTPSSAAESKNFTVNTEGTYSASSNVDWITTSKSGKTLTLSVTKNTIADSRSGVVTVSLTGLDAGYSASATIKVTQSSGDLIFEVDKTSISTSSAAYSTTAQLTTNADWDSEVNYQSGGNGWITLSPTSGSNSKTLSMSLTENRTTSQRKGTITLKSKHYPYPTRTISVSQDGKYLTVSPESLTFSSDGEQKEIQISTDGSYSASKDVSWLTVTQNGSTVKVSASANTSPQSRSGNVTILLTNLTSGSLSRTVSITQSGTDYHLSVSPNPISVNTSLATTTTMNIETNDSWTLTEVPSWFTPSVSSGTGNKTVTLSLTANNTTHKRHATFKVNGVNSGISVPVEVSQIDKDISVSPSSWAPSSAAESKNFTVTTEGTYSASSDVDWISTSKSGNTLILSVTKNNTVDSRSGVVTVSLTGLDAGYSASATIHVTQPGSIYNGPSVDVTSFDLSSSASTQQVQVTSDESWSTSKSSSWITISSTTGSSGTKTVTISVTDNTSSSSRSGSVTFTGDYSGKSTTVNITQSGQSLEINPSSITMAADGDTKSISVSSIGSYSVSPVENWISASQSGSTTYITVTKNTDNSARVGTVQFSSGTITRTLNVTQKGQNDISIEDFDDLEPLD